MRLLSGAHCGWRASLKISVTRLAVPPATGRTQMLPCKSIASILPSGETETCMEVPSWTMMVWCCGGPSWARAVPAMAQRPATTGIKSPRRMHSPIFFVIAGEPIRGKIGDLDKGSPDLDERFLTFGSVNRCDSVIGIDFRGGGDRAQRDDRGAEPGGQDGSDEHGDLGDGRIPAFGKCLIGKEKRNRIADAAQANRANENANVDAFWRARDAGLQRHERKDPNAQRLADDQTKNDARHDGKRARRGEIGIEAHAGRGKREQGKSKIC